MLVVDIVLLAKMNISTSKLVGTLEVSARGMVLKMEDWPEPAAKRKLNTTPSLFITDKL